MAVLNLGYFGVEFGVALTIGSVSLFADSIDFLEDAAVNGLILVALEWNARSIVRMALAAVLFALPWRRYGLRGKAPATRSASSCAPDSRGLWCARD